MFRVYNGASRWCQGLVQSKIGQLHYKILHDNRIHKRHIDQLRSCGKKVHFDINENCISTTNSPTYNTRYRAFRQKSSLKSSDNQAQFPHQDIPATQSNSNEATLTPPLSTSKVRSTGNSPSSDDGSPEFLGFYTPEEQPVHANVPVTPVSSIVRPTPTRGRGRGLKLKTHECLLLPQRQSLRQSNPPRRFSPS